MMIRRERFILKYALVWLVAGVVGVVVAVFPGLAEVMSLFFGFETTSNFIFFLVLCFLLAVCLSLSAIVSKQSLRIKDLVQEIALLDVRDEKSEND